MSRSNCFCLFPAGIEKEFGLLSVLHAGTRHETPDVREPRSSCRKAREQVGIECAMKRIVHSSCGLINGTCPHCRGLLKVAAAVEISEARKRRLPALGECARFFVDPVGIPVYGVRTCRLEPFHQVMDSAGQIHIVGVQIRKDRPRCSFKASTDGIGGASIFLAGPISEMIFILFDDFDAGIR